MRRHATTQQSPWASRVLTGSFAARHIDRADDRNETAIGLVTKGSAAHNEFNINIFDSRVICKSTTACESVNYGNCIQAGATNLKGGPENNHRILAGGYTQHDNCHSYASCPSIQDCPTINSCPSIQICPSTTDCPNRYSM